MALNVITIPCRADNYAYLLQCSETGKTAVVDVPDATPILATLKEQGLGLDTILITHHHDDHISGVKELREKTNARVVGAKADEHRLPPLDIAVSEGDTVSIGSSNGNIIDVSGHTIGHIAFLFKEDKKAFSADSLMALGCGRIFEGTQPQMWETLQKFMTLDPETLIYSGHEYVSSNAQFALTIEPNSQALKDRAKRVQETLAKGGYNVPVSLREELETNPFLRANLPDVKELIGMPNATDAEAFGEIRTRKDNF